MRNIVTAPIEVAYFALVVGLARLTVDKLLDDPSENSLIAEVAIVLVAGVIAILLHTLMIAPLRLSVIWHKLNQHNVLEASDLPITDKPEGNRFACRITLEPTSIVSHIHLALIKWLDIVPVITIGRADTLQIVSEGPKATTLYPIDTDLSSVEFEWAATNGISRLRSAEVIKIFPEESPEVLDGPSSISYSLRLSHRRRNEKQHLKAILITLLDILTLKSINITRVYVNKGA